MRIAFAGNPNSGKTTTYNALTGRKWFWGGVALQFATGYVIAYLVYQIGTLITTGSVGAGFLPGLIVVAAIVAVIVSLISKTNKSLAAEYALKK